MKIILKEAVPSLGNPGEIREVAAGYARNFLIPRGLAVLYGAGAQRQWQAEKEGYQKKLHYLKEGAAKRASSLENLELTIKARTGEGGKLFGSISKIHIAKALEGLGIKVDRQEILLKEPLKELGAYPVDLKLHPDTPAKVTVTITSE